MGRPKKTAETRAVSCIDAAEKDPRWGTLIKNTLARTQQNVLQAKDDLENLACMLSDLSKKTVVVVFAMGKLLSEVKDLSPHGQFIPWVKANCCFTIRAAQRFMAVYECYKNNPRQAFDGLTITEAFIEAGVKKLSAPQEPLSRTSGQNPFQPSLDGLPNDDDYRDIFNTVPASGIPLKSHRIIPEMDGNIYMIRPERGICPVVNLLIDHSIPDPAYQQAVAQVYKDLSMALEAFYYRLEQFEEKGVMPAPFDLRMGHLMRCTRTVSEEAAS